MLRAIMIYAAILLVSMMTSDLKSGESPNDDAIWKMIQGKPNPRVGDEFEVIDGFPLVAKREGISLEATALSAILTFQFQSTEVRGEIGAFFLSAQMMAADQLAKQLSREPKADLNAKSVQSMVWKYLESRLADSGKRVDEARRKCKEKVADWKTEGVCNAYLLDMYLTAAPNQDAVIALQRFASERLLTVIIQKLGQPKWETIKESIDKQIPLLIRTNSAVVVAVGYYAHEGTNLVLLYDPAIAIYRENSMSDLMPQQDKESQVGWIKNAMKSMKGQNICSDWPLSSANGKPTGVSFGQADKLAASEALCVYMWAADTETEYPKLLAFIDESQRKAKEAKDGTTQK